MPWFCHSAPSKKKRSSSKTRVSGISKIQADNPRDDTGNNSNNNSRRRRKKERERPGDVAATVESSNSSSSCCDSGNNNNGSDCDAAAVFAVVLQNFVSSIGDELSVQRGQVVEVMYHDGDWSFVRNLDAGSGYVPKMYCLSLDKVKGDFNNNNNSGGGGCSSGGGGSNNNSGGSGGNNGFGFLLSQQHFTRPLPRPRVINVDTLQRSGSSVNSVEVHQVTSTTTGGGGGGGMGTGFSDHSHSTTATTDTANSSSSSSSSSHRDNQQAIYEVPRSPAQRHSGGSAIRSLPPTPLEQQGRAPSLPPRSLCLPSPAEIQQRQLQQQQQQQRGRPGYLPGCRQGNPFALVMQQSTGGGGCGVSNQSPPRLPHQQQQQHPLSCSSNSGGSCGGSCSGCRRLDSQSAGNSPTSLQHYLARRQSAGIAYSNSTATDNTVAAAKTPTSLSFHHLGRQHSVPTTRTVVQSSHNLGRQHSCNTSNTGATASFAADARSTTTTTTTNNKRYSFAGGGVGSGGGCYPEQMAQTPGSPGGPVVAPSPLSATRVPITPGSPGTATAATKSTTATTKQRFAATPSGASSGLEWPVVVGGVGGALATPPSSSASCRNIPRGVNSRRYRRHSSDLLLLESSISEDSGNKLASSYPPPPPQQQQQQATPTTPTTTSKQQQQQQQGSTLSYSSPPPPRRPTRLPVRRSLSMHEPHLHHTPHTPHPQQQHRHHGGGGGGKAGLPLSGPASTSSSAGGCEEMLGIPIHRAASYQEAVLTEEERKFGLTASLKPSELLKDRRRSSGSSSSYNNNNNSSSGCNSYNRVSSAGDAAATTTPAFDSPGRRLPPPHSNHQHKQQQQQQQHYQQQRRRSLSDYRLCSIGRQQQQFGGHFFPGDSSPNAATATTTTTAATTTTTDDVFLPENKKPFGIYRCAKGYQQTFRGEISLRKNELVIVLDPGRGEWAWAVTSDNREGLIPKSVLLRYQVNAGSDGGGWSLGSGTLTRCRTAAAGRTCSDAGTQTGVEDDSDPLLLLPEGDSVACGVGAVVRGSEEREGEGEGPGGVATASGSGGVGKRRHRAAVFKRQLKVADSAVLDKSCNDDDDDDDVIGDIVAAPTTTTTRKTLLSSTSSGPPKEWFDTLDSVDAAKVVTRIDSQQRKQATPSSSSPPSLSPSPSPPPPPPILPATPPATLSSLSQPSSLPSHITSDRHQPPMKDGPSGATAATPAAVVSSLPSSPTTKVAGAVAIATDSNVNKKPGNNRPKMRKAASVPQSASDETHSNSNSSNRGGGGGGVRVVKAGTVHYHDRISGTGSVNFESDSATGSRPNSRTPSLPGSSSSSPQSTCLRSRHRAASSVSMAATTTSPNPLLTAIKDYVPPANSKNCLSLRRGDVLHLQPHMHYPKGWMWVWHTRRRSFGFVPKSYVAYTYDTPRRERKDTVEDAV